MLKFVGSSKDTTTAKKLIESSMLGHACTINTASHTLNSNESEDERPPGKKMRTLSLCSDDQESIIMGEKLSDLHMNHAQELLKRQFPTLNGLECTLTITMEGFKTAGTQNKLQILHCRRDHWITATNINCGAGIVHVYDSVFSSVDKAMERLLRRLFSKSETDTNLVIKVHLFQKQKGGTDCGLFAVLAATAIAFGFDRVKMKSTRQL